MHALPAPALPSTGHTPATPYPGRGRLAEIRADGLRLLTWAPRKPEALPEGVRRQLDVLTRAERQAVRDGDRLAAGTFARRIRALLRGWVA